MINTDEGKFMGQIWAWSKMEKIMNIDMTIELSIRFHDSERFKNTFILLYSISINI